MAKGLSKLAMPLVILLTSLLKGDMISVTSIGDYAFYGCTSLVIYCEAQGKPSGWDSYWNSSYRTVVWGHSHSYEDGECVCGAREN